MTEGSGELTAHLTTGAVVVYVLEWLKNHTGLGFLTPDTKALNRFISACSAAVIAAGINWTYDAEIGRLVIDNLTWSTLVLTAWEWLKQFVVQQVIFDTVIARKAVDPPRIIP